MSEYHLYNDVVTRTPDGNGAYTFDNTVTKHYKSGLLDDWEADKVDVQAVSKIQSNMFERMHVVYTTNCHQK